MDPMTLHLFYLNRMKHKFPNVHNLFKGQFKLFLVKRMQFFLITMYHGRMCVTLFSSYGSEKSTKV